MLGHGDRLMPDYLGDKGHRYTHPLSAIAEQKTWRMEWRSFTETDFFPSLSSTVLIPNPWRKPFTL